MIQIKYPAGPEGGELIASEATATLLQLKVKIQYLVLNGLFFFLDTSWQNEEKVNAIFDQGLTVVLVHVHFQDLCYG